MECLNDEIACSESFKKSCTPALSENYFMHIGEETDKATPVYTKTILNRDRIHRYTHDQRKAWADTEIITPNGNNI